MANDRIFELRSYRSSPGRLTALLDRFRQYNVPYFAKHGISVIGYWNAPDEDDPTTGGFFYICEFDSKDAADEAWLGLRNDEEWKAIREATEAEPLAASVETKLMKATDFSPIQ